MPTPSQQALQLVTLSKDQTHNSRPQRLSLVINQHTCIIIKPHYTSILPLSLLLRPHYNCSPYVPAIDFRHRICDLFTIFLLSCLKADSLDDTDYSVAEVGLFRAIQDMNAFYKNGTLGRLVDDRSGMYSIVYAVKDCFKLNHLCCCDVCGTAAVVV